MVQMDRKCSQSKSGERLKITRELIHGELNMKNTFIGFDLILISYTNGFVILAVIKRRTFPVLETLRENL